MLARLSCDSMLLIEDEVIEALDSYRQTDPRSSESAGVLLGYRRANHIHVVQATSPGKGDVRSRFAFWRADPSHQAIASREWRASGKTRDYLGEWHTHPEVMPAPSSVDLAEWRVLCRYRTEPLIFLILGTQGNWVGLGKDGEFNELSLQEAQS